MKEVRDCAPIFSMSSSGQVSTQAFATPLTRPAAASEISSTAKTSIFAVIRNTEIRKFRSDSLGLNSAYLKLICPPEYIS